MNFFKLDDFSEKYLKYATPAGDFSDYVSHRSKKLSQKYLYLSALSGHKKALISQAFSIGKGLYTTPSCIEALPFIKDVAYYVATE